MVFALIACGAAGGNTTSSSSQNTVSTNTVLPAIVTSATSGTSGLTSTSPVAVQLSYTLPTTLSAPAPSLSTQSIAHRHLEYISTSNAFLTITVTPVGGGTTSYGPTACTTISCTVSFTANPGPNTLTFTLTDNSSNVLSSFSTLTIIQPSVQNTLSFTANPIVKSAALQLATSSVNAGTPSNTLLSVNALDADNNTIVGNSNYLDTNGNPVTLTLDVANSQAGGKGRVALQGPTYITTPAHAAIYAHYDGGWLDHSTISITANSSALTSLTGATLTTTPADYSYSNGITAGQHFQGLTTGPDGNLWAGEINPSGILRMTPQGVGHEFTSGLTTNSYPQYPVVGADGNLWFAEFYNATIGRITPSGVISEFGGMHGSDPVRIAVAPNGLMWFGEQNGGGNYVGTITTKGVLNDFTTSTNGPRGVGLGPDGNIWVASSGSKVLSRFTPNGTETDFSYTTANTCLAIANDSVVTGPDGNIWFVTCDQQGIGKATPSGSITVYTSGISGTPNIFDLTVGPDSNLWFTENNTSKLGRITTSGTVTEYTFASGGANPFGVTVGPDGNLWVSFYSSAFLSRFVY